MITDLISIEEYCRHHHTEVTFIEELEQSGLIRIIYSETTRCIPYDQLEQLEKYTTLYNDLEVNIAGIEVVHNLLGKLEATRRRLQELEAKLRFYEKHS